MEALASMREDAAPVSASSQTMAQRRGDDRALAMLFLSVVLTMYMVIGVAVYHMLAVLF